MSYSSKMLNLYESYNSITDALLYFDLREGPREQEQEQQQTSTSRSSHQLYRYNHEPVTNNLLRRDIPPVLILIFFLFLVVLILSQILIVHKSRYGSNYSSMQQIQEELKQMDESMETILRDNVLPIDQWRLLFHIQKYAYRFQELFRLSNKQNSTFMNSSDNQKHKNYCDEQPSQLRMFKRIYICIYIYI